MDPTRHGPPSKERFTREWNWAAEKMIFYGGSFAEALGGAFLRADQGNKEAILREFGILMESYLERWPYEAGE